MGRAISMKEYLQLVRCPNCSDARWVDSIRSENGTERIQLYCLHCRAVSIITTNYGKLATAAAAAATETMAAMLMSLEPHVLALL